jgi:tetratricopeptide (TPR) repeat protein
MRFIAHVAVVALPLVTSLALVFALPQALAQQPAPAPKPPAKTAPAKPAPARSSMDAQLFYQLLIGELQLQDEEPGNAYVVILDAARRTKEDALFSRAIDIALSARAGEQALAAARQWRQVRPDSTDAMRMLMRILSAMGRPADAAEPAKALLAATPAAERAQVISGLPRYFFPEGSDKSSAPAAVKLVEDTTRAYLESEGSRAAVRAAQGQAWLLAGDADRAFAYMNEAQTAEPNAPAAALLALDLMRERPKAETVVKQYLGLPKAQGPQQMTVRLGYASVLTDAQRYSEAVAQLDTATRLAPQVAGPYLTLGALHLELRQPQQAEQALQRFVELAQQPVAAPDAGDKPASNNASSPANALPSDAEDEDSEQDSPANPAARGLTSAWLMLAQAAEQRSDYAGAEGWLARITDPRRALEVQSRRASILAKQGKLSEARALIRSAPERSTGDGRAKLTAEVGLLREAKSWREAYDTLAAATARFPEDSELIYEQAMMAEKLDRLDEMERLLRRVIALKPSNAHAHNALGYSLADRRQRLPEARQLIQRALELAPGDPFITDSLGWVEFRMGNREEALRLLQGAFAARPDVEIGTHLGEVLWALGRKDEARRYWREAREKDAANEVLRETLTRLRVDL